MKEIEPHIKTIIEASIDLYTKTQKEKTVKGKVINVLADRLKYDAIDILRILKDD